MTDTASGLPVIVQKAYEFNLWIVQKVKSFRRSFRFTVGDRLIFTSIDIPTRLVDAANARDKARILGEVNGMLNRLRFLLRMAKDRKFLGVDSYGYAAGQSAEIGRMAGALGTTIRGTPAFRTGTTTNRRTGTITSGFTTGRIPEELRSPKSGALASQTSVPKPRPICGTAAAAGSRQIGT
ncbi:MAG TPA: four helix bundle protein [Bryobacteraceae bacterium]